MKLVGPIATLGLIYVVVVFWYGPVPKTMDVGYQPEQPVPFSHRLHAGDLKIDCRYCHTTVEKAAFAAIPPTATCLNCHGGKNAEGQPLTAVHASPPSGTNAGDILKFKRLAPIRESGDSGMPVEWVKVHDLPDYVYFDHSAHVTRGVSCVECHGRVDRMDEVYQAKELSMSWCLDCHRNPDARLRPPEFVTKLDSTPEDWAKAVDWAAVEGDAAPTAEAIGRAIREQRGVNPSTHCSTCHR